MVVVLYVLVGLMILFWGSRVGPQGLRITFFGLFTFYEANPLKLWNTRELRELIRKEVLEMFPSKEGEDEEEDDDEAPFDGRDLWDRLKASGFTVLTEERDPRAGDIGLIDYWFNHKKSCSYCDGQVAWVWEVCASPNHKSGQVMRAFSNPIGLVCTRCGSCDEDKDDPMQSCGVIGPVMEPGTNFFDVLEHFEKLRNPQAEAEPNAEAAQPATAIVTGEATI
ncbi:MAG: hypothetical protein QY323_04535 [Patescibacteria group bacterium]|nr:MAG: hypothetical protein QY323_04535 [Patescibacteria group bacterium]